MCSYKPIILLLAIVIAGGCASSARPERATPITPAPVDILDGYAAILKAEDRRAGPGAVASLLADPRAELRARAARAAGRIAYPGAAADLEPLLADDEATVRSGATVGLGLIGDPENAVSVAVLIADPDSGVRADVARALGWMAEGGRVEPLLRDPDPEVVIAACFQTPSSSTAIDALLQLSESEDPGIAFASSYALSRLAASIEGEDRSRIRSRLVSLALHENNEVRMQAALGLSVPGNDAERAILAKLAEDPDFRVRVNAVVALGYAGAPLDPALGSALRDGSRQVVAAAFEALGRIGTNQAVALLLEAAGPRHPIWLRVRAVEAIGNADSRTLLSLAPKLLREKDPRLGAAAVRGLVGRTDPKTLDLFRKQLGEGASAVRAAAAEGLAAAQVSPEELGAAAQSEDPAVRAAVARAVGRWYLGNGDRTMREAGLDLLSQIWTHSTDDDIVAARLAVVDAASMPEVAKNGSRSRKILEAGLEDPDWRVRHRAARALRNVFGVDETDRVGPASDLPLEHYREIVTWARAPRAAVITVQRPSFTPGRFTVALDTDAAPLAAWNFARLAQERFYDGTPVFRLDLNRTLWAGDPRGDGFGGPGYSLPEETTRLAYTTGLLGMARGEGGSHGSQWFTALSNQPELDGRFTMFGHVEQNLAGVLMLVEPDDVIVSIRMYEGDGTEPLPPRDR